MRRTLLLIGLVLATPAIASEAAPGIHVPQPPARPDPDAKITITFGKLQRMLAAVETQSRAACMGPQLEADLKEIVKAATPEPKASPAEVKPAAK